MLKIGSSVCDATGRGAVGETIGFALVPLLAWKIGSSPATMVYAAGTQRLPSKRTFPDGVSIVNPTETLF